MRYDSPAKSSPPLLPRLLAALAVLTALAGGAARADRAPVFALVGGRVVTVSGAVHEGGTVILRDGLIEAVGAGIAVPSDARVVDAKGLVVTPGLIDGFGGVGLPSAGPARPGGGGGASASPAPGPEAGLRADASALDAIRAAEALKARDHGVTTALVIGRDGVVPGRSAVVNLSGETAAGMVLRAPFALHLNMTTLQRQYPGSLMGTVAYSRQALLDAGRYRDEWAAYERAPRGRKRPRYDAGLQAWTDVLAGKLPLVVGTSSENDVRRALALGDEFKVRVVLAGGKQAARALPVLQARKPPLLLSVNFDPPSAGGGGFFGGGADDERTRREIDEAERQPARLQAAGVPFALVSGHAPDLLAGTRKAIERGLPREAALRALTLGAAEALGMADRLGSLEPGKIANVVAWSAEPLTADAKARLVFVDGELYEPDEKPAGRGRAADAAAPAASPAPDAAASPSPAAASPRPAPTPEMTLPEPKALPRTFAVTGATILTASPQGTIARGTIVVKDGKIASVSEGPAPAGVPIVNAEGQFVTPGLIDAHSHIAVEGNVNECTDIVTAEVRVADVIDHRDPDIYRNLAGGVTMVNVLHGSCNAIGGQNAVLKLRRGKAPEELVFKAAPRGIKFALGENPKRSNFNVPGQRRYPRTRMGVEAVLRRAFEDARAYRREWDGYQKKLAAAGKAGEKPVAPRRDLRLEELVDILDGKVLVHAHCYRADEILMLIKVAEDFGFKIKTFQHVLEGYKVASEIARHGAGASTFSDWWAYKLEAFDAIPYNAAIMAGRGVNVSLNSDSPELSRRLYWEAAKAVKYGGVSEDDALEMVTINPAWQLGVDKQVGSIEAGKDADLTVFNAHPFSPEARVEMTIIEGVAYFDRERDLAARSHEAGADVAAGERQ
jgi:imidazolonepropionase-like amidohydrolase